jgi:hypothetical protein
LDDGIDRCGRIFVRLGRRVQSLVDFVDSSVDGADDRLFGRCDVACRFVAPTDGVLKLLFVVPHRLRV